MRNDSVLGKTEIPCRDQSGFGQSVLVLGTAQLGLDYGITNTSGLPPRTEAGSVLRTAQQHGVTHADTARAYGLSEQRIGGAAPVGLKVVTKVAPLGGGRSDTALIRRLETSIGESERDLGERCRPAALLLHRAWDAAGARGAVWERLRHHRAEGRVARIGVSVQSPAELTDALGLPDLGYVQLPFNVLDRRWLNVGEELAHHDDLVVTARSVFLQGLLLAGRGLIWPGTDRARQDLTLRVLESLVADFGRASLADLCIAYVLSVPWVTSVVIGAETASQVRDNAALVRQPPLTAEQRHRLIEHVPSGALDLVDPSRWAQL